MALIYNYILGYDTDDNTWFHNVDAEADLMNCSTVYDPESQSYINEYSGDGIYLPEAEELIVKLNNTVERLNIEERLAVDAYVTIFNNAVEKLSKL